MDVLRGGFETCLIAGLAKRGQRLVIGFESADGVAELRISETQVVERVSLGFRVAGR